jgi:rfaE bifunctional protein nucleotidyltransferase chain/domain
MVTLKEVLNPSCLEHKLILDFSELDKMIQQLKTAGYKIVLTQGVYDMFHVGHGRYLAEARSHGDILVVGVDSDELTRSMKGPTRPFDTFEERAEILSMLGSVNIVTRRDVGQDKYDLIKLVHPDVLIMSQTTNSFGDEDKIALENHCGKIEHLQARAATSTSAKMLRLMTEGKQQLISTLQDDLESLSITTQRLLSVINGGQKEVVKND